MNLPNKLTIIRVLLVPIFIIALLYDNGTNFVSRIVALLIFVVASATDWFDGYIARKYNLITDFGKLMDPQSDKLLVASALVCFVELGQLRAWVVIIIIAREFIISGFRIVAANKGKVLAAAMSGKIKTVSQMITIILLLINQPALYYITLIMTIIMLIMTVYSMIEYLYKNMHVFKTDGI